MNKLTKKLMTVCLSSALALTIHAKADEPRYNIENLPSTSHEIVKQTNDGKVLYIADSKELADALTGGVIAINGGASLLTLDSQNISEDEEAAINNAESVYLLGGRERISEDFEQRHNFVERFSGEDRFETAVKIAENLGTDRNLVIVNGLNYVDAITSTPLSILEGRNILMVTADGIPESTSEYLKEHGTGKDIIFVGGEDSISKENKQNIFNLIGNEGSVDEATVAGEDRYQTSLKVAARTEGKNIVLANGEDFNSALMSVNYTKSHDTMTVLVSDTNAESILDSHFGESEKTNIYSIGIKVSLSSDAIEEETENNPEEVVDEVGKDSEEKPESDEVIQEEEKETEKEEVAPEATKSAQSFINAALAMEGWEYSQSMRMSHGYADCSSLVLKALINSGLTTDTTTNLTSETIWGDSRFYQVSYDNLQPGDVCYTPGHLAIYMGDNTVFEAKDWGVPAGYGSFQGRFSAFFRITGL